MGINVVCSDCTCNCSTTPPNPNPSKFQILRFWTIHTCVVVELYYDGCTTFEGTKLCVYEQVTEAEFRKQTLLDPHFREDSKFSPIARFPATVAGLRDAFNFCRNRGN